MVIDVHGHLGRWSFPMDDPGPEDLTAMMDRLGIDRCILSSSRALRYDLEGGNRELSGSLRSGGRLFGYITANLHYPEESIAGIGALEGERKDTGQARFVGVKIHPMIQNRRFDTPAGFRVARRAHESGLPILIHTFGSPMETPRQVLPVLREIPDLRIILAHAGGFDWHLAADMAAAGENLYAEICSSCTSPDKLLQLIEAFGDRRVLFGTDATLFHPGYALGMVRDADLPEGSLSRLMGENALDLFRFQP